MKKFLLFALFFTSIILTKELLIIDTAHQDNYTYNTLNLLSKHLGFSPLYKHVYEVDTCMIENNNTIVISIDPNFFSAYAQELARLHTIKNPLLKHTINIINTISIARNKTVLILMPPATNNAALLALTHQILTRFNIFERTSSKSLEEFANKALLQALPPDTHKSFRYDTTLLNAQKKDFIPKQLKPIKKDGTVIAALLPFYAKNLLDSYALQPLYPFGFYTKNLLHNNQFFILNASIFHAADIQEPFILTPMKYDLRTEILNNLSITLAEFFNTARTGNLKPYTYAPTLPEELSLTYLLNKRTQAHAKKNLLAPSYNWLKNEGITCGWLSIGPYKKDMATAVKHLLQSGLSMLWLQLTPEFQLSVNGVAQNDKKVFFENIAHFTATLLKQSKELNLPLPKLFVGMEMTGNFVKYNPHDPATDVYGKVYSKIPSPLDFKHFWKPELIDVFDAFYTAWQNNIGNSIPLSGVFLDLEMYHAQKETGQFLPTMDFSNTAWNIFITKTNRQELATLTLNERLEYLLHNKLFNKYFNVLKDEAFSLGNKIRSHIAKKLPEGIIAGYNINLPHTWFYTGFIAGLSSPDKPVIFATFNNEFYPHCDWLIHNNIHLLHLPVILLSKLQKKEDFKKATNLWNHHDGIWFNRISRLEEPRTGDGSQWDYGVETTPLDTPTFISLLKEWITLHKPKK